MGTGVEELYIIKNNKKMRFGFTTGSCAAAAAGGAAQMLLSGEELSEVKLMTPKGIELSLPLQEISRSQDFVTCAVKKDAGDDPDTTNGMLIYATVRRCATGYLVDGGEGIGRVTKPGLKQNIGEAAINPVPKAMIRKALEDAADRCEYDGGLEAIISAPEGREIAKKTFNPRLGIEGGISILGTTGIEEPMSEAALVESIAVEMRQRVSQGEEYLIVTPGNYGADYLKEHMNLPWEKNIKCSNYVGETIDLAINLGVKGILFVAHIGKFAKVAGGIMNTHSHAADGRMEILCANAIRAGADLALAKCILECNTTDEVLAVLKESNLLEQTIKEMMEKIQYYLNHRSYEQIQLGAVVFSNEQGFLGQTESAVQLMEILGKESE